MNDIRQALRSLARRPGFALVVVATFALGIGANTAIFSVVDGVLWKPLELTDADRVVVIAERDVFTGGERLDVSPANFVDVRDQAQSFAAVAAMEPTGSDLFNGTPETVPSYRISDSFLDVVGTTPLLGRGFTAEEHRNAHRVVILSEPFWRDRFASDPAAIGTRIAIDGESHTIIGVLASSFRNFSRMGPSWSMRNAALWLPRTPDPSDATRREARYFTVLARLAPGVRLEDAHAELDTIALRLAREYPDTNGPVRFDAMPIHERLAGGVRDGLLLLLAAVSLVLLITCANVVNLLLARASEQQAESTIRAALGAGRGRLIRQRLVETGVLAAAGAVAGVLLARLGIDAILALGPNTLPRADEIGVGLRVLGFSLAVTVATALLVGILPALHGARHGSPLRVAARGTVGAPARRFRDLLVSAQIALAFVLLVGAGLLGQSFARVVSIDPGFRPERLLVMQLFVWDRYETPAQRAAFFREAAARLERMPQVDRVAASSSVPFAEVKIDVDTAVTVAGEDRERPGFVAAVTEGYFGAMEIPLRAGRSFTERDAFDAPRVAILSETMARDLFGNGPAIGRRIRMAYGRPVDYEVVGIAGDVRQTNLLDAGRADVYVSHGQSGTGSMTLVVRTNRGDALASAESVKNEIWEINPTLPIYSTHAMEGLMADTLEQRRFVLALLGGFSILALALATIGIYGVMSFNATRRIPEMGVRAALGATRRDLAALILGEASRVVVAGLLAGTFAALVLGPLVESMLVGTDARDPATFVVLALVLVAAAGAACWVPTRRAARAHPATALRYE
ncbi:MAG: ABC transporter permease [Thermoanaerobaculia bacterium]